MKTTIKELPAINLKKASRKELEKYIKKHIPFYQWVDLCGHSEEQLRGVIERNKKEIKETAN